MVLRAWDAVSWYEGFKKFPFSNMEYYSPVPQVTDFYETKFRESRSWKNAPAHHKAVIIIRLYFLGKILT